VRLGPRGLPDLPDRLGRRGRKASKDCRVWLGQRARPDRLARRVQPDQLDPKGLPARRVFRDYRDYRGSAAFRGT
jgi:hypothetical protein